MKDARPRVKKTTHPESPRSRSRAASGADEQFKTLVENSRDPIVRFDTAGRYVYVNPAFTELAGQDATRLLGRNCYEIGAPKGVADAVQHNVARVVSENHETLFEYEYPRPDGARWYEARFMPETDARGRVVSVLSVHRDITERNRQRKALEEMRQRERALVDSLPDAVWLTDASGVYLSINKAHAEWIGKQPRDIVGKTAHGFLPPEVAERFHAEDQEIMRSRKPLRVERESFRGSGVWREVIKVPIADGSGRVTGLVATSRDITARKRLEESLRRSEERLRLSQNFANIGAWDWNIRTGELHWSERIAPMFGYQQGELETTYEDFLRALHPEDRQRVIDAINACVERGAEYNIEHRIIWPDGTVRWMHERGAVTRAADGTPLHMHGIVQDVTDRKLAETALRESERKYRALVEDAGVTILVADLDTLLMEANKQAEQLLGYSRSELIGRSALDLHPPSEHDRVRAAFADTGHGRSVFYEGHIVTREGALRDIEITASPIEFHGQRAAQAIFHDVTDKKVAERELLAQAERQRDALVREVHHRIKNHLQSVAGLLRVQADERPEVKPLIEGAIGQVQAVAVVHGLHGQSPSGAVLLCEMVSAIAELVGHLTRAAVNVRLEMDSGRPIEVSEREAVPVALLLNELILNAVKHHPAGIQPEAVEITVLGNSERAAVQIVNPGALPPKFDFSAGTGLGTGLRLVKSLLPLTGARLGIRDAGGRVEARLELWPPAIV